MPVLYYKVRFTGPKGISYLHYSSSPAGGHHFESEKEAKYKMRLSMVRWYRKEPNYRVEIVECSEGSES